MNKSLWLRYGVQIIFFFGFISVYSQTSIDSIQHLVRIASHDTIKCKYLLDGGDYYERSQPDSALYFYEQAERCAYNHLKKISQLTKREAFAFADLYSKALRYRAIIYIHRSTFTNVIPLLEKSLRFSQIIKNQKGVAACYTNMGVVYFVQGYYDKALEVYFKALKITEATQDLNAKANLYNNIANLFVLQQDYNKAIDYYGRVIQISQKTDNEYLAAQAFINIAIVYKYLHRFDKALTYLNKAMKGFEKFDDNVHIAACYTNLGVIFYEQSNINNAIAHYEKALKIYTAEHDSDGIKTSLINLAEAYLSNIDSLKNNYDKMAHLNIAKKYAEEALRMNITEHSFQVENVASYTLMRIYDRQGNKTEALRYAKQYIASKDSLFSEEKSKAIAEVEAQYKAEKQQRLIEKFQHQKELSKKTLQTQQAENQRQRTVIWSVIIGIILLSLLLITVTYFLRQNQIANRKLKIKNYQISKQKEELAKQRDEIASQRDIVIQQKKQIETYHKALKDSINYAENIQRAVLPSEHITQDLLKNYFLIYLPRDIVSGDFFWIKTKEPYIYVAVADCTGHGVPGSLMSMLAVSYLNELSNKREFMNVSEILDYLRLHIISSLGQGDESEKVKDGLDIILIAYNKQTHLLQYAGANNPLYIIKSETLPIPDETNVSCKKELIEITPDKMPVGFHPQMKPFTLHEIEIQQGDTLYLCTDGFSDQFGGKDGKKFLRKNLKQKINQISSKPLTVQKNELMETLNNWKNQEDNYTQTDDITVLAWKIENTTTLP